MSTARADAYGLHFDRVVVDTAPTGHTLRLLTFPEFLDRFIDRLLLLKERFRGATAVVGGIGNMMKNFGGAAAGGGASAAGGGMGGADEEEPKAVRALIKFQAQMRDLQALLTDGGTSEFVIVSIPTALSLTESERLQAALGEQGIAVRKGVINRLVPPEYARKGSHP